MADIVDLEEVKAALQILHDDDDGTLGIYIRAASRAVITWLGPRAEHVLDLDSSGEVVDTDEVPDDIRSAAIIIVAALKDGVPAWPDRPGALPQGAEALLYRYGDPPLA